MTYTEKRIRKTWTRPSLARLLLPLTLTISFVLLFSQPSWSLSFGSNLSQRYPINRLTSQAGYPSNPIRVVGARGEHLLLLFEVLPVKAQDLGVSFLGDPGCRLGLQAYRLPVLPGGPGLEKLVDVLVPLGEAFPVGQESNLVAVVLKIPRSQPPGSFHGKLVFREGEREVVQPLTLRVWRFTLPEDLPVTIMGSVYPFREWFARYGVRDEAAFTNTIAAYLKILRAYKLNAIGNFYPLPMAEIAQGRPVTDFPSYVHLLDEAMALGYRRFRPPTLTGANKIGEPDNGFERQASRYYSRMADFLRSRHLMDKALVKVWDEPKAADFPRVAQAYGLVKQASPELATESSGESPIPSLAKVVNVWAVFNIHFDRAKVAEAQRMGQEIWLYANMLHGINKPAACQRLVGWYLYSSGCSGYLLWSVNYWPLDPWTNPPGPKDFYRRGTFLYPNPANGQPLPSLRLEAMRRGWEDYQYLTLLREAAQQGKVDPVAYGQIQAKVATIAGNLQNNNPKVSWQELENLRIQIGRMLQQGGP